MWTVGTVKICCGIKGWEVELRSEDADWHCEERRKESGNVQP